ncbi:sigma-70 family RNA polymerase sigma factor [Mycolicibacterium smegmatis]|uniref:sigma-70 family RNA polymerase sigma factor n=1 Tax=Mycolicibacterium smegmatis TaxID=1772 RepID=UPI001E35B749|nr:sigma-70 family RNA polymerase sigma factor [Mycolicibacterium smegmatis]UGU30994.1 sigma-70 family RNA polymerase sigma factor [Mycolicibacterium smegmatis]ULN71899.1 sigma-70 family RNA polymerase sigma factor [Mycolicibacterium smegmatis]
MTLPPDLDHLESEAELTARFIRDAMPYQPSLLRTARRLARTEADAEDLVQDALLNAYVGFRRFRPGTNLRAWLFRIMHNRWISTHRMTQRRPATFCVDEVTDGDLAAGALHVSPGWRSAEDEALDTIPDAHVRTALDALPEGFRTVVYYADIEGFTYAETAVLMGIPVGTVMSRIARARQRLRAALTEDAVFDKDTEVTNNTQASADCAA